MNAEQQINKGVINDPPPTPVMPTSNPTPKPESEYNGSIMCEWWQTPTTLAQAITRSDRSRFPLKQVITHIAFGSISRIAPLHDESRHLER
jgi:hypothetical protein